MSARDARRITSSHSSQNTKSELSRRQTDRCMYEPPTQCHGTPLSALVELHPVSEISATARRAALQEDESDSSTEYRRLTSYIG